MPFSLPPLPYDKNALAPHISAETLEYHHGKHHQAYVTNLNKLLEGKPDANKKLEDIIVSSEGGVFNNVAQIWNHTFFWHCLSPKSAAPGKKLADANAMPKAQNIGYPGSPEEILAFMDLIHKTAPRWSDADREKLQAYLIANAPKANR